MQAFIDPRKSGTTVTYGTLLEYRAIDVIMSLMVR